MTQITSDQIQSAYDNALFRWQNPFPEFTSGFDTRTSDNALLVQIYGGLDHAANYNWLNAGRRLIDKTYINMLWHVQSLSPLSACSPESTSAALDSFILEHIQPVWHNSYELDDSQKKHLADLLVTKAATLLFGSLDSEIAASRLLFMLCPMLPVYNFSLGNQLALQTLDFQTENNRYSAFANTCTCFKQSIMAQLEQISLPQPTFGTQSEQTLISQLLNESDWWERRVVDALLQEIACKAYPDHAQLFSCTSQGQLPFL